MLNDYGRQMANSVCEECGTNPATKTTPTGRGLCNQCFARYVAISAAGVAVAAGSGTGDAIITGVAAGSYATSTDAETAAAKERKAKLASTEGAFKRLWVRIVG